MDMRARKRLTLGFTAWWYGVACARRVWVRRPSYTLL